VFVKEQHGYEGGLNNPMSWDRTVEKFHWLSEAFADEYLRNRIINVVQQLDARPMSDLMDLLAQVRCTAVFSRTHPGIQWPFEVGSRLLLLDHPIRWSHRTESLASIETLVSLGHLNRSFKSNKLIATTASFYWHFPDCHNAQLLQQRSESRLRYRTRGYISAHMAGAHPSHSQRSEYD
jgi:hypothetical protein